MRDPIVTARQLWLIDNAAVVAAACEDKYHIVVGKKLGFVDGFPRRDVIGFSAHREYRGRDVLERDDPSLYGKSTCGNTVFKKQAAQIL